MKRKEIERIKKGNYVPVLISLPSLFGDPVIKKLAFIPGDKVGKIPKTRYTKGDHSFTKNENEYIKELEAEIDDIIDVDVKKLVLIHL